MRSIKPLAWKHEGLTVHGRRRLPHFRLNHRAYFFTIRLADSIPWYVQEKLDALKLRFYEQYREELGDPQRLRSIQAEVSRAWEAELDRGYGRCELGDPANADLVSKAFEFFDGDRYALISQTVMPNHGHAVAFFDDADRIPEVLKSWKGYTAHEINRRTGRQGRLWQPEYFDRTIRDDDELSRTIQYVMNNAAVAGLKDWPFQKFYPDWTEKLEAMRKKR